MPITISVSKLPLLLPVTSEVVSPSGVRRLAKAMWS